MPSDADHHYCFDKVKRNRKDRYADLLATEGDNYLWMCTKDNPYWT
jgi:hypothetical protein